MISDPLDMSHYDYFLPNQCIAKIPILPKSEAKLLVYERKNQSITHTTFREFSHFLPKDTLLVFNDTKVIKARFFGMKFTPNATDPFGKSIQGLFHKAKLDNGFIFQFKGKLKANDWVIIGKGDRVSKDTHLAIEIVEDLGGGLKCVRAYEYDINPHKPITHEKLLNFLETFGHIPLPPYLKREDTQEDGEFYQTVFASKLGAIAAPTASLHFTEEDIKTLQKGFKTAFITLHVGAGTFQPIVADNAREHKMHEEFYYIPPHTQKMLESTKHITAIGTTVARTLEFYKRTKQTQGMCDLFLNPANPPHFIHSLLTNFHLPKSTLIMLVAGLIGIETTQELYKIAKENHYRFYSYGDGMLIL